MKKFLALILSLLCVFALAFTACGDNTNDNDETNNPTDNNQDGNDDNDTNGDTDGGNDNENTNTHTCIYNLGSWASNSQTHWHASLCPEHPENKKDEAPHNFVNGKCLTCNRAELYNIGDKLPDFEVETYESSYKEGTFSSEDARGKVLVINFWYVQCGICVEEMPDIEKVKNNFGDDVVVLALHIDDSDQPHAQVYIDSTADAHSKTPWSNYKTIFGKDFAGSRLFNMCGGTACPFTVILNGDGVITDILNGNLFPPILGTYDHEDHLTPAIQAAMDN